MTISQFRKPALTPTQQRVEAIIKTAADLGMGGFALSKLRTVATAQIEPLMEALRPFANFAEKAEQFVGERAADGGSPIMPTKEFRLSDFRRARDLSSSPIKPEEKA